MLKLSSVINPLRMLPLTKILNKYSAAQVAQW